MAAVAGSLLPFSGNNRNQRINSSVFRCSRCQEKYVKASSSSMVPPLPEDRVVVGCGMLAMDYVAAVDNFPKPNEKMRSKELQFMGGGNAGNALTCASRLGLRPKVISKVGDDSHGRYVLAELETDGVDTSYVTISKGGNSMFSYVIVDKKMNTRTSISQSMFPPMVPDDLHKCSALSALDGSRLLYLDCEFHEAALVVAEDAVRKHIPILVDAERKQSGLDDLLNLASYIVCPEDFPEAWTSARSIPSALISILVKLPRARFVIVTLEEKGCLMLERSDPGNERQMETLEVESLVESLMLRVDQSQSSPICVSMESTAKISARDIGTVYGKLHLATAESIPSSELVDTTGAGDAFAGAVLYALCTGMSPEKMLPFASLVAAIKCRAVGARTGLPRRTDPRLAPFLN